VLIWHPLTVQHKADVMLGRTRVSENAASRPICTEKAVARAAGSHESFGASGWLTAESAGATGRGASGAAGMVVKRRSCDHSVTPPRVVALTRQ
jgi:hypothetical protein